MARLSTYRVQFRIVGWVEVEAKSSDDAIDLADAKTTKQLIEDAIGSFSVEFDEVELNP